MRRAVILATLILLLLAVAGITVAQESDFSPERDFLKTEPTAQEATTGESTELTGEEPVEVDEHTAGDVLESSEEPEVDDSEVTEDKAAKGESKREKRGEPKGVGKPEGVGGKPEGAGAPAGKGKPEGVGKGEKAGGPRDGSEARGDSEEATGGGGGQQKITLCHKDKNTITVGAPAKDAHLSHGDSLGPCRQ